MSDCLRAASRSTSTSAPGRNRSFRALLITFWFSTEFSPRRITCANGGTSSSEAVESAEPNTCAKAFKFARKARVSHHLTMGELPTQLPARCFCYPQSIREIFAQ